MTEPTPPKGRSLSHEIEIDADRDTVWRAITEAHELTRWYVEDARVTPGEGGTQWVDWGGGQAMETTHLVWQPGERLVLGHPDHAEQTGWNAVLVEFEVETLSGNRTRLRVTQSGLPEGPEWDGAYDGTDVGWQAFIETLRIYLEQHLPRMTRHDERRTVYRYESLPWEPEETWSRLLVETLGLPNECFVEGARAELRPADGGDALHATIHRCRRPGVLVATLAELSDAVLFVTVHRTSDGGSYLNFILGTYTLDDALWSAVQERWTHLLETFTADA